jgi:spore coat polysaccharide biosynthesis protein SpsF (cytidylyltransferase family)
MRTIAVIQARMGSTRLPGKILESIEGRPLLAWTIDAIRAVPQLDDLVLATSDRPEDDAVVAAMEGIGVRVHRGSVHDVLRRVADAVRPLEPDVVLRQTGDNPFVDPEIMSAQLARLDEGPFDYVGIAGLPLGIGGEAVRAETLWIADREATEPADREHVLPFVYARPERFAIGSLTSPPAWRHPRYTVDTPADLAFARAVAARLPGRRPPARLGTLEAIVADARGLTELNATIVQRGHQEAELDQSREPKES